MVNAEPNSCAQFSKTRCSRVGWSWSALPSSGSSGGDGRSDKARTPPPFNEMVIADPLRGKVTPGSSFASRGVHTGTVEAVAVENRLRVPHARTLDSTRYD